MRFGKKKSILGRMDLKLYSDLDEASRERMRKGLADPRKREQISIREMTELLTKTEGYKLSLFELKTKPKKKNGK